MPAIPLLLSLPTLPHLPLQLPRGRSLAVGEDRRGRNWWLLFSWSRQDRVSPVESYYYDDGCEPCGNDIFSREPFVVKFAVPQAGERPCWASQVACKLGKPGCSRPASSYGSVQQGVKAGAALPKK